MAKIVLGLASSHTPQLSVPASQWSSFLEKDQTDPRIDYQALLKRARPGIQAELTPERMQERADACEKALTELRSALRLASPDVIVALGDDQHEQFLDDNMPMFCVYYGQSLPLGNARGRRRGDSALTGMSKAYQAAEQHALPAERTEYAAYPELALHLIHELMDESFDLTVSNRLKTDVGLGHAFTFLYRRLLPEDPKPMVPIMINTFYPPNAPPSRRCYALGQSLRRAIETWDSELRVAIVASGGLSHVIVDEDLDRRTLDAMVEKDAETLCALPEERMTLGTSEIRNWIAIAGAMEPWDMLMAQYVPCYRTPAGTGCGMGFAYWM
jgi:hypothetical protein